MTEKLYDSQPYLNRFDARVIFVGESGGKYCAVLDRTAFFPEQGGQYSDKGTIGDVRVTDVQIKSGAIYHYTESPLDVGREYECVIDFEDRFRKMQNHSGEHIVSGLVHSMFNLDNVGFHLGNDDVTIDYNGFLTREQLLETERRANEAVVKNIPITAEYPLATELEKMQYRSKIELTDSVRIVTIPGYDVCACCAPHVARTGEIGVIKLLDSARYKGGIRIHMLCGFDALDDYNAKYENIHKIALALTAKQHESYDAVKRIIDENSELKYRLSQIKRELNLAKYADMEDTDGNICIFEDTGDINELRDIANLLVGKCGGLCAVFGKKDSGYSYVIGSQTIDMSVEAKKINTALSGKGGGKKEMIQGSVLAPESLIRAYFCK